MDVVLMEAGVARPSLVLRGLTELAQIRSLCTWGALLLAAVAALGSLLRALRKTARWLRLHRARLTIAAGGGGGGGMAAAIVPEPSVDFSDDEEEESERGCSSPSSSDSDESGEENEGAEEEARRVGCSVDDESETESEGKEALQPQKRRYQQQDWGFGVGGWESWFGGGRVVKDWEQTRGKSTDDKGYFSAASHGGGGFDFVPLIRSFCLDNPALTLSCSDDGLDLRLCDSRMRSSVPAAVIAPAGIRKRAAVGVREAGADGVGGNKVLYVAERRGGNRAIVDLRNTKAAVGTEERDDDTWWDADAVFVSPGY